MRPSLAPQPALHVRIVPPERLLLLAEALKVPDALLEGPTAPEEQLEEELAPEALVAGGGGQPGAEPLLALRGDRVHLAVRLALLSLQAALDQTLRSEVGQDRVDLPIALAPEVGDAALDALLEVIAGAGPEGEHAQDRVLGGAALARHISIRYTSARYGQLLFELKRVDE